MMRCGILGELAAGVCSVTTGCSGLLGVGVAGLFCARVQIEKNIITSKAQNFRILEFIKSIKIG
jgi:hypothetical protein